MFGIKTEDMSMYLEIERHGLTVEEASRLRKLGTLPPTLAAAWNTYDAWLATQQGSLSDG